MIGHYCLLHCKINQEANETNRYQKCCLFPRCTPTVLAILDSVLFCTVSHQCRARAPAQSKRRNFPSCTPSSPKAPMTNTWMEGYFVTLPFTAGHFYYLPPIFLLFLGPPERNFVGYFIFLQESFLCPLFLSFWDPTNWTHINCVCFGIPRVGWHWLKVVERCCIEIGWWQWVSWTILNELQLKEKVRANVLSFHHTKWIVD